MKKLLSFFILCLAFVSQAFCENAIPNNEIWYTSSDEEVTTLLNVCGVQIVSNTYENGLGRIVFDGDVTSIGENAFMYADNLTSVILPNSVTSIGDYAFICSYGLTSITLSNSLETIGKSAFEACYGLTSITLPNSVTSIGESAFDRCFNLTSITLSNSLTSIGESAFEGCSGLISINIPNSVTNIGKRAFSECISLTSIIIPNSVTSIGDCVFSRCSSLTDMYVYWDTPIKDVSIDLFGWSASIPDITLHVPSGTKALYEDADVWKNFGKIVDDASALNSVAVCDEEAPVYSLDGIRQNPSNLTPGVYVQRGKKMIVR